MSINTVRLKASCPMWITEKKDPLDAIDARPTLIHHSSLRMVVSQPNAISATLSIKSPLTINQP